MNEKRLRTALSLCALALLLLSAVILISAFFFPDGFIKDVLLLTHHTVQRPRIFGAFHLISLALCIALTVAVFIFHKKLVKHKILDFNFKIALISPSDSYNSNNFLYAIEKS